MYKKGEEEGYIERTSKTYKELMSGLANANQQVDQMDASYKPGLDGEKYYTGAEVMSMLHITRRTLQEYRDKWLIPYTTIGGTILYPESKMQEVLDRNYYKPPE